MRIATASQESSFFDFDVTIFDGNATFHLNSDATGGSGSLELLWKRCHLLVCSSGFAGVSKSSFGNLDDSLIVFSMR